MEAPRSSPARNDPIGLTRSGLLHEILTAVARRRSDSLALSQAEPFQPAFQNPSHDAPREGGAPGGRRETMTYAGLDARADAFSRQLARRGVRPGDRVVIHLPRGLAQYWALLGVMKAGAAYVPVDWSYPRERIQSIAADCDARAIVTWGSGAAADGAAERIDLALAGAAIGDDTGWGPACSPDAISPEDIAYIIYTSGSTGQPKGVMIRHRNACGFVAAESAVLGLTERDRVFGAFSLAFDMSIETMWTAWAAGAELVCASEELARSSHDLPAALAARAVSVWHVTPSLLGAVDEDVPSLRLINLGGEACPAALVRRWWRPGRRLVNTYGPTETAVTATWAELTPDRPVTIGRPLPGYHAWIVDEDLAPVAAGVAGELIIGGAGVGAGYVGRPELTAARFIAAPHLTADAPPAERMDRVYRTGDLVRLDAAGEIEFIGRADTQIKVRGYRVELEEIEAVLAEHPAIGQVAVKAFADDTLGDHLAAFVTPRPDVPLDMEAVRAGLVTRLPNYMRPQSFTVLPALPMGVSGKVDRGALPRPAAAGDEARMIEPPGTALEEALVAAWSGVFPGRRISVFDDFFDDLGGHSLIAARMVSAARHQALLGRLSIQDVYRAPTVRLLAARVMESGVLAAGALAAGADRHGEPFLLPDPWRRGLCVAGQTAALVFLFGLGGLQWLFPYLVFEAAAPGRGALFGLEAAAAAFTVIPPLMTFLSIALKWLVIGRVRAGDYPLWGAYYFRWWLSERVIALAPVGYLVGTPLLNLYLRCLGARIGKDVFLGSDFGTPDLLSIGDRAIISSGASLATTHVDGGRLRIGAVRLAPDAFVGDMAIVGRGAEIGAGGALDDLAALSPGGRIGAGERWSGSPARRVGPVAAPARPPPPGPVRRAVVIGALMAASFLLPFSVLAPIIPGAALLTVLAPERSGAGLAPFAPLLALSYVVGMCLLTVAAKWALLGRIKAGRYAIWSGFYVRYWFVERLNGLALDLLHPIFATLYVRPWYRLLGAKVGRRCELSSASAVSHDLIEFGEESFIADGVSFGAARMEPGALRLDRTRIGRRTFIGNSALLPTGARVADGVLIGVLSKPPEGEDASEAGATWFGSPPLRLPNRPTANPYSEKNLFRPARRLVAARLAIEYLRITLALTIFVGLFCAMLGVFDQILAQPHGRVWLAVSFPAVYLSFNVAAGAIVVALKWLVVGRYRGRTAPLWSLFVWRTELVTSTYESLVAAPLLGPLRGTPYINVFLRLMGCRIGKRVFTDTSDITEFDLVKVGDDAALNADCGLQTHLFEDRVMKLGPIDVGPRTAIGRLSIVLYDSVLEEGTRLGDLSVVMKGETLPAETSWEGSPAQAITA